MTGHSKSNSNDDDEVESVQVPTEKTNKYKAEESNLEMTNEEKI